MITFLFAITKFNSMDSRLNLISLLAGLLILTVSASARAQDFAARFSVIDHVETITQSGQTLPNADSNWKAMTLPYGSLETKQVVETDVIWMRFNLEKPENLSGYSLYFHRHNLYADIYFNGERIGGDTTRPNRYIASWNHPLLVNIQNANWRKANNEVIIRFVPSYFGGNFFPILFGETEELTMLWENTYFKRIQLNRGLQLLGVLVTVLACSLWLARRNDTTYLLLGGMAAMWTVITTHMVVYYNLIEHRYWLPLVHLAIHIFTLLFFNLLLRLGNFNFPFAQKFLLAWFAVAVVWNQLSMLSIWWMGTYALHGVGNLFVVYLLVGIARKAIMTRDKLAIAISFTVLAQLGFFIHDLLMIVAGASSEWETGVHYTQFAFPLLLVVFAAILMNRFLSALSLAENLNTVLEAKVEASRQIIERSYAEKRQLELQQATEQERQNIYRDLHDDVGSKLLSIIHAGRDNTLGELARTALESLRSAVSRANSVAQPLNCLLQDMQEETKLRLEGSGHRLNWNQPDQLPEIVISASRVFNLNQVFRELVTNIIRHANASEINFNFKANDSAWSFELIDNGVGLSPGSAPGNGINNIKQRVNEINGTHRWQKIEPSGTQVIIEIPQ
jgi:signal transduction histidine kinase